MFLVFLKASDSDVEISDVSRIVVSASSGAFLTAASKDNPSSPPTVISVEDRSASSDSDAVETGTGSSANAGSAGTAPRPAAITTARETLAAPRTRFISFAQSIANLLATMRVHPAPAGETQQHVKRTGTESPIMPRIAPPHHFRQADRIPLTQALRASSG